MRMLNLKIEKIIFAKITSICEALTTCEVRLHLCKSDWLEVALCNLKSVYGTVNMLLFGNNVLVKHCILVHFSPMGHEKS